MLNKKVIMSSLLIALFSMAGIANAGIKLIKTTDGTEFTIPKEGLKGTPAEAEFLKTGKNIYVGDAEAEKRGGKRFGFWSCTQCHGPTAKGQVGPGLVGPTFKYPKDITNQGMFETIWYGTNGGMGGKGFGVMAKDDGLSVDELLKIIAWVRTQGSQGVTGNEDDQMKKFLKN